MDDAATPPSTASALLASAGRPRATRVLTGTWWVATGLLALLAYGRVTRVYLTAKGRRLRPTLEAAASAAIESLTRPLNEPERETLRSLLARMAVPHIASADGPSKG